MLRSSHERALLLLLLIEVACFAVIGTNFFSWANAGEIVRLGIELGLLALALTAVILTGGIDLSVGALMGLSAVCFGYLTQRAGVPILLACLLTLLLGAAAGMLNGLFITRLKQLPLLTTLGSLSLFRGLAEGMTGAVLSYSQFPSGFLALGQGRLLGVPAQFLVLLPAVFAYWILLHRSRVGRSLYAIGHAPAGARYAGLPVDRHLRLVYTLSGLAASAAALVYVARIGQAKSDAGTGFELTAITAVVLGGTSIFGGRGTVGGTLLGLATLVVLQNGMRLAGLPTELAGIATGLLLLGAIGSDRWRNRVRLPASAALQGEDMKNSQVAVLSGVILLGAGLVALSNWWAIQSLRQAHVGSAPQKRLQIAMMPKAKGDPYFISCRKGAEEAARDLQADLLWDGPTELDPARQNEVAESWITKGVDAIAVSVENRAAISTVLRKARAQGIKVLSWDADAEPDARDLFVNQATPQGIGATMADQVAEILGGKGEFAVVTGSLSAANQNEWLVYIRQRVKEKYPAIQLVAVQPCDSDRDRAFAETQTILKVHPNVRAIVGLAAPAVPGVAEAVKQSGRKDVFVTGLSLPNLCKPYIHAGVLRSIVLWNTRDLGYLTVQAAAAASRGQLAPQTKAFSAGRMGQIQVQGDNVMLGVPFVFTKANIDRFDF